MTEIIKFLEIVGTVAFSVSGALIAIGAGLDLFGVVFVGCITAFGGGMIRDILLGITPPLIFSNYIIFLIAVISSLIVFTSASLNKEKFNLLRSKIESINNYFDAVGLAAFSVTGAEMGFSQGYSDNVMLIVVLGMITGVGGGIIRDIIIDTTPYVFKKHVYALASIFGSFLYFFLRRFSISVSLTSVFAMSSVIIIRVLATKYRWSLPKITIALQKEKNEKRQVL